MQDCNDYTRFLCDSDCDSHDDDVDGDEVGLSKRLISVWIKLLISLFTTMIDLSSQNISVYNDMICYDMICSVMYCNVLNWIVLFALYCIIVSLYTVYCILDIYSYQYCAVYYIFYTILHFTTRYIKYYMLPYTTMLHYYTIILYYTTLWNKYIYHLLLSQHIIYILPISMYSM